MKIYLVYAKIPKYLNGWAEDTIDDFVHYSRDEDDNSVGLYAWTIKKKYFNQFKKTRSNDFFVYSEKDIPEDAIEWFRKEVKTRELTKHSFALVVGGYVTEYKDKSGKGVKMILVSDELDKLYLGHDGYIPEAYYEMSSRASEDYYPLNNTIIDALDMIGYTTDYDINFGGDDEVFDDEECYSRRERASYNMSYQLAVEGSRYINLMANEFNAFMMLYAPLIFGKENTITKKYKRGELH